MGYVFNCARRRWKYMNPLIANRAREVHNASGVRSAHVTRVALWPKMNEIVHTHTHTNTTTAADRWRWPLCSTRPVRQPNSKEKLCLPFIVSLRCRCTAINYERTVEFDVERCARIRRYFARNRVKVMCGSEPEPVAERLWCIVCASQRIKRLHSAHATAIQCSYGGHYVYLVFRGFFFFFASPARWRLWFISLFIFFFVYCIHSCRQQTVN